MKLGSIVGIVLAGILIITGIIMCMIGSASAKGENKELFMQIDDSGTHYIQDISSEVTKLSVECKDADIKIIGGAERSFIEFNNFNPNKYSVNATANVISFSESADISSLLDLGDIGFSFKGLRYFLDPRNDDFDEMKKSIIINLAADSMLKIIDIDAEHSTLTAENVNVSGDMILGIKNGSIEIKSCTAQSAVSITGTSLKVNLESSTAKVLRSNITDCEMNIKSCLVNDTDITAESGRIDFISETTIDDKAISVTSESGGILFNSKPLSSPFNHEPLHDADEENAPAQFKIKCLSASVNLSFPSEITTNTSPAPTVTNP